MGGARYCMSDRSRLEESCKDRGEGQEREAHRLDAAMVDDWSEVSRRQKDAAKLEEAERMARTVREVASSPDRNQDQ